MQVKELKNEGLMYELEVVIEAKDIDRHVDAKLQEYGKNIKLPGFRPGKVPVDILKQRYGKAVLGEVLESAVNDSCAKAIEQKGLRPAMQPRIEIKEFDEGKDLKYMLAVEVLPEFKVMDLKTLKLEKPVAKVEEKAIDETLERIAKQNVKTEAIKSERASKKGDFLVIDFHGRTKKDGKEHPGMHAHGHKLELGSGQFIAGFEDQLTGKKAGEKVTVSVTFPQEYHAADLAGQEAEFDVDIHEIHEAAEVKVDDEFAKSIGFDDLKAVREAVKNQMQAEYDQVSRAKLKRALLDRLDEAHDFEVPGGMMALEFSNIKQQLLLESQDQVKDGELKLDKEEEEELEAISERRVRLGMILSEIGRENNIAITDQELQRAVITEAQRYPGQEAQVFEYYRKNQQALEALRAPVFEDKVVDFIIELADVKDKEVSLDELTAEDESSYLEIKKARKGESKGKGESKSKAGSSSKAPAKAKSEKSDGGEKKAGAKKPAARKKSSAKKE